MKGLVLHENLHKKAHIRFMFETTKALADKGDAKAQFNLGYMYDLGEGVDENKVEAVKWYQLAAKQRNGNK